jgi:signal transduction histidine kinase
VSQWPQALRTTVGLLLRNHFPILLWWGPEFVQIYNDAYRPVPGVKHPRSMGQRASECWHEIWHVIGPMIEAPFRGGPASTSDDLFLLVNRKGFVEETHFKVAYSPVPDETVRPTGIGGVIATVAETTEQVYGERQLRTLRELGARATEAATAEEACAIAGETLETNTWDVPFALFYLLDRDGRRAELAASVGFETAENPSAPAEIDLTADTGETTWPLARVLSGQKPEVLGGLDRLGALPRGRWSESPRTAIALPLSSPDQPQPYGVLVCGVSPHRALDDGYRTFFELAAQQVVTAIRNARALEMERKRAESLAELDRAKTLFFSNVSHEFRTPLTLLMGPLEEALASKTPPLSDGHRAALEISHRNALRLLKLVNALLDFSRVESGKAQAAFEPVDLAELTENLASVFRSAVEKGGLALRVECASPGEPVWVDRDMWEKVVLNLLSNAFKFTFQGEIAVRLRPDGDHVLLEIADTGIGIAEDELPRIFDRFHRIPAIRSRTHEGSGIGLSLVHDIVQLHGGAIEATSTPGHGTTFRVKLPRGHGHLPAEQHGPPRAAGTSLGARPYAEEALRWLPDVERGVEGHVAKVASLQGAATREDLPRILLADDNADMRLYVRGLLAERWTVETAADGQEALEKAMLAPPDLVLSDVMMPRLDGFALLRELRRHPKTSTVPVILLSARAGEESKVEGLERGADDYLVKPFSAQELIARVGANLELARLRRRVESELRDSNEELERRVGERTASLAVALRELETFSYTVAHDLRSPLRAMRQLSDLLLEDYAPRLGATGRDYARRIGEAAARMDRLTADLLEWSRLTKADVQRDSLDLPKVVAAACSSNSVRRLPGRTRTCGTTRSRSGHRGRQAPVRSVEAPCPKRAHVRPAGTSSARPDHDGARSEQHATLDRRRWRRHRPDVSSEALSGLRAFRRGRSSGTGMGLALAKKAVERMGGEIGVVSRAGSGSRFFVELPAQSL